MNPFIAEIGFVLSILMASPVISQKLDIKKDIIMLNKRPIAKLEGKVTFANGLDVTIMSLNDEPLLHVSSEVVNYHSIFYEAITVYAFEFLSANLIGGMEVDYAHSSEKKLIEFLYETIGPDFLTKDGLNQRQVDAFVAANKEEAERINADTIRTFAIWHHELDGIKEPVQARDMRAPPELKKVDVRSSGNTIQETFEVRQSGVLLGRLIKSIISSGGGMITQSASYMIWRWVNPFTVGDEIIEFAHMTVVTSDPTFGVKITSYCKGTWSEDLKLPNPLVGEFEVVNWLIGKGCL